MMEWGRLFCCFSLLSIAASVSAIQILQDIEDLKGIEFGHEYPRHGLLLLHWLADHVSFNQTLEILLHFEPGRRDYGFQLYKTSLDVHETALPQLDDSLDRAYYSLGHLSSKAVRTQLPPYVTQDFYNSLNNPNRDIDRIVVRVHKSSPTKADKVYITQALSSVDDSDFDRNKTYEISLQLLKQVQALQKPLSAIHSLLLEMFGRLTTTTAKLHDPRLKYTKEELFNQTRYNDKHLKTIFEQPGLRWFLSLAGYDIDGRSNVHKQTWLCSAEELVQGEMAIDPKTMCEGQSPMKIEVKSTTNGYARLTWSGVPKNILEQGASIVLFKGAITVMMQAVVTLRSRASGFKNTDIALNHGLQARLTTYKFGTQRGVMSGRAPIFWRGPQFDSANRVIPTKINGYDASLQVYTKDGYVCVRLYIKKSFTDWKKQFRNSWVGLYTKEEDGHLMYMYYEWVDDFKKASEKDQYEEYLIYDYKSNMSIGPGVQARFQFIDETVEYRFLLKLFYPKVLASTVPWEKADS